MFYTYVLYSPTFNKIYIGQSANLEQRLISHNETGKGYTARFRPWQIVYFEVFQDRAAAMKREKQLKGGKGRAWIKKEIIQKL